MTLRKTLKNLRELNRKFYLVLWEDENTVSIVRDVDITDPSSDKVTVDSIVSVKVHRKVYKGKVAAIGSRDDLTTIEKTYTEKRLNTITEESSDELESDDGRPTELATRETNLKRDLEEPMESDSPIKKSRKDDKRLPVRRKNASAATNDRKPSSAAKLNKAFCLEEHIYDVPITSSTPKPPDSLVTRPSESQTITTTTACPPFSLSLSQSVTSTVYSSHTNGLTTPVTSTASVMSSLVPPPLPPKPARLIQNGMGTRHQDETVSRSNVSRNHQQHSHGLTQTQVYNHCLNFPPTPVDDWYKTGYGSPQSTCGVHGGSSSGGDPSPAKVISDSDPLLLEITIMGIDSRVHKLEEQMNKIERTQNLIVQRLSNIETFCSQLYQFTQGPHNYPPPNPFYCTRL